MLPDFQCRSCESRNGEIILDHGKQPLANNLLRPEDLAKPEPSFPLRLAVCTECWLLQLTDCIPPVQLFSEYVYFSSCSDVWLKHAADCARRYLEEFALGTDSFVVEIASNDGYLLRNFAEAGIPHLGIEPAQNVAAVALKKGVQTLTDFFSEKLAKELAIKRKADLIIAYNVFAHAPDINDFVAGLKGLLAPRGRVILEFPYASEMIANGEFDTVYHEHVFYFTLCALQPIFDRHDLSITSVERTPLHGGSLRLFVRHENYDVDETVITLLMEEEELGVMTPSFYHGFSGKAERTREVLRKQIAALRAESKTIAAYGAAAKGAILLNYCGFGAEQISFVVDRSPHKQGRLMPGGYVPIVSADELAARAPDVTLLLAWNFMDEILAQQATYRDAGGQFLIPIPKVRLV
ncbi:MAG: class I SAM-dependent methyltransferase [Verrucomicrobiota bacterium]|jgi:SAM-dependent methyltransferase|nr:class I SAM-dependent methyltransferase [Verrucomicrobiota bacterium]